MEHAEGARQQKIAFLNHRFWGGRMKGKKNVSAPGKKTPRRPGPDRAVDYPGRAGLPKTGLGPTLCKRNAWADPKLFRLIRWSWFRQARLQKEKRHGKTNSKKSQGSLAQNRKESVMKEFKPFESSIRFSETLATLWPRSKKELEAVSFTV